VERLGAFACRQSTHTHDLKKLKYVDLGGGFPAHTPKPKSREHWAPQEIGVYIHAITETLERFFPNNQAQPTLIVEPGRYLACEGIILVTRVIHVKSRDGRQVINCNGSISMVPLTHYSPQIIRVYTPELQLRTQQEKQTIIYGSTCRENDILYEGSFAETMPGDYLVHYAAGAYNSNLSPNFIFESPGMELI
jgi:diaminopimelate decarboxylase